MPLPSLVVFFLHGYVYRILTLNRVYLVVSLALGYGLTLQGAAALSFGATRGPGHPCAYGDFFILLRITVAYYAAFLALASPVLSAEICENRVYLVVALALKT